MKPISITALNTFFYMAKLSPRSFRLSRQDKFFNATCVEWMGRLHRRSTRENTSKPSR